MTTYHAYDLTLSVETMKPLLVYQRQVWVEYLLLGVVLVGLSLGLVGSANYAHQHCFSRQVSGSVYSLCYLPAAERTIGFSTGNYTGFSVHQETTTAGTPHIDFALDYSRSDQELTLTVNNRLWFYSWVKNK